MPDSTDSNSANDDAFTADHPDVTERAISTHFDTVFRILADAERRHLLHLLATTTGPRTLTDLATTLADTITPVSDEPMSVDQLLLRLRHVHLPLLEDADVLMYHSETETIHYNGGPILEDLLMNACTVDEET